MTGALSSIRSVEILTPGGKRHLKKVGVQKEGALGILDGRELICARNYPEMVDKIFEKWPNLKWESVVIYYGKEGNIEEAERILQALEEKKPRIEAQIIRGSQSSSK